MSLPTDKSPALGLGRIGDSLGKTAQVRHLAAVYAGNLLELALLTCTKPKLRVVENFSTELVMEAVVRVGQ